MSHRMNEDIVLSVHRSAQPIEPVGSKIAAVGGVVVRRWLLRDSKEFVLTIALASECPSSFIVLHRFLVRVTPA